MVECYNCREWMQGETEMQVLSDSQPFGSEGSGEERERHSYRGCG
jgi:hypothetical protein